MYVSCAPRGKYSAHFQFRNVLTTDHACPETQTLQIVTVTLAKNIENAMNFVSKELKLK